jgi:hypothetical protein
MRIQRSARIHFSSASFLLLVLFLFCGHSACNSDATRVEKPIVAKTSRTNTETGATSPAAEAAMPAGPEDVQQAVHRVFGEDVVIVGGDKAIFVTGDFNGDGYQDLLVLVRPANNKLAEINDELANWIIQNPRHTYVPPRNRKVVLLPPPPKPEKVRPGEPLLAVIHGYGSAGWRNPIARQAYLLREATGKSLRVAQPSEKLRQDFGRFPSTRDLIAEDLGGINGVLYWTGAGYGWHSEQ